VEHCGDLLAKFTTPPGITLHSPVGTA
jgi:hypothetical protein